MEDGKNNLVHFTDVHASEDKNSVIRSLIVEAFGKFEKELVDLATRRRICAFRQLRVQNR